MQTAQLHQLLGLVVLLTRLHDGGLGGLGAVAATAGRAALKVRAAAS